MGVALQRCHSVRLLPVAACFTLWFCSLLAIGWVLLTRAYDPPITAMAHLVGAWLFRQLAQARVFWFDWVFGSAITAHLLGARTMVERLSLDWIAKPARWCSGVSFAAYLFHMPLLTLFAAFLPAEDGWLAIGLTLAVIAVLGPPVERSKRLWRAMLTRVTDPGYQCSREEPTIAVG